jgi:hypothetical protein
LRSGKTLNQLKSYLVPGQSYRRSDLALFTSSVDRDLILLLEEGALKKVSYGLYSVPKTSVFGESPPDEYSLLRTFLKDDHFVVYNPSQFNTLGLGTTQLYNRTIVFNRKRVGEFRLGSRNYSFHRWREAPKTLSQEFLVVECVNRLDELAEDRNQLLVRLKEKLVQFNRKRLFYAARHYGTVSTQKTLLQMLNEQSETLTP